MASHDMDDSDWPECAIPGCDNLVNPRRVALGRPTCIELHSQARKEFLIIPVPKSNPVVGPVSDLVGISNSHRGNR